MEAITKEVIALARQALDKNDYVAFFEAFDFKVSEDVKVGNVEESNAIDIETYTDGGEDMIITVRVDIDWKADFKSYVEDFDINENVMGWWRDGEDKAHSSGVPFDNIHDHYDDYEDWLAWLEDIVSIIDGKDPVEEEEEDNHKDELQAIRRWVYWSFNYPEPKKFIRDIWGDTMFANHIME